MPNKHEQFSIAVLDDCQGVALSMADWSVLEGRVSVTVFNDHIADIDAVVSRLLPFDIVCVMRERTPMTRAVIASSRIGGGRSRFWNPSRRSIQRGSEFGARVTPAAIARRDRPPDPGCRIASTHDQRL